MEIRIGKDKQQTAVDFTDWFIDLIDSRKILHVALSGGSTPKIVFDELSSRNIKDSDWQKIHLYWGDERCVEPDNPESNYKMTKEYLLSQIRIPEDNIHRVKGEHEAVLEAKRYSEVLKDNIPNIDGLPKFDLVILGMGDDGHTASIFPYEIDLWNAQQLCEVAIHPDTEQKRITITGKVINHADIVAFLVTGDGKAQKVGEIIDKRGDYLSYPAALVYPTNGELLWFLDEPAAVEITSR